MDVIDFEMENASCLITMLICVWVLLGGSVYIILLNIFKFDEEFDSVQNRTS